MDPYLVMLAAFGFVALLTAWVPVLVSRLPLSVPIFCIALGAAVACIPGFIDDFPHPLEHRMALERICELILIVALTGAGLKLDRPPGWRAWASTWRLLGISMPLTIAAIAIAAWVLLGVGPAAALLLGAMLAPTDPVLAGDIQSGPPSTGGENEIRFSLTSEAGLNDGLAFPFVSLAIIIAEAGPDWHLSLGDWMLVHVMWKIVAGVAIGWAVGYAMGVVVYRLPRSVRLARSRDGLVSLGLGLIAFGIAQLAGAYGFLAVFVAGVALRGVERNNRYNEALYEFADEVERLGLMLFLVGFGAAITAGGLLDGLTAPTVLFALVTLFAIRPAAGWLGLAGSPMPAREKAVIGFFGIRGIGTLYYLAYALGRAEFESSQLLASAVALTVLLSIVIHGVTVTPVMSRVEHPDG